MNIERFHNELAMQLGYERIVNDSKTSNFHILCSSRLMTTFAQSLFLRLCAVVKIVKSCGSSTYWRANRRSFDRAVLHTAG